MPRWLRFAAIAAALAHGDTIAIALWDLIHGRVPRHPLQRRRTARLSLRERAKIPLFAVVRIDHPHDGVSDRVFDDPSIYVTVKEVLPTFEDAEREVERLNRLNADKGCVYFASHTRYFPSGRSPAAK